MELFSYIMTVATSKTGVDVFLSIRNIAGTGRAQFGRSGDFGNAEVWIIPKSKKSKEEFERQLQTVPFVQQFSVVQLSKPVTKNELLEVYELLNSFGWDMSAVKDEELSLFLEAKLQGKYTYMLDFEHVKGRRTEKVRIIRAEEHPHFSPEWLANSDYDEEVLDRELTIEDLEIQSVVLEEKVEEPPPPPPPPPIAGDQHDNRG